MLAWPVAARAQQPGKLPFIGFIVPGTVESHGKWIAAFTKRMGDLGWVDGRTANLAYRFTAGHLERYAEIAAEFARLNADVIVTSVGGAVTAAREATPRTPIVYTAISTGSPFIASLAHPGGMVTGLSQIGPELGGKRLAILQEVLPQLRRVALLGAADGANTVAETAVLTATAQQLGIEVILLVARQADEIAPLIASVKGRAEALYVMVAPFISINQTQLNALARDAQLPTMHGLLDYVASGGLLSYGVSFEDLFRRAGDYVDKILRGARPADLPVEQPTKYSLAINMKTAKALGLKIPESFLVRADEVIE